MWLVALASAGQVMVEDLALDALVDRTDAAAVVKLGAPAMTPVSIPVPGGAGKKCGPYAWGVWELEVVEPVLPARNGPSLAVGQRITVWPATVGMILSLERLACVEGVSKSPIVERYDGVTPEDGGTALVLVRWEPPWGWVEAAGGSWLAAGDAKKLGRTERPAVQHDPDAPLSFVELACRTDAECTAVTTSCGPCGSCPSSPLTVMHRDAARWMAERCQARFAPPPPVPQQDGAPDVPPPPAPACAPCPGDPPAKVPKAACREVRGRGDGSFGMRCVEVR